jgi:uncharacterized protein (TIGR03067 family)
VFRTSLWTGAALLLTLLAGPSLRGDDAKGDLKKIQGTWTLTTEDGGEASWLFDGDNLTVMMPNAKYVTKVSIDEKGQPQPAIDIKINEGPDDAVGKTSRGIYKLDGDHLTVCVSIPDGERPKALEAVEGAAYLFKLTKKK